MYTQGQLESQNAQSDGAMVSTDPTIKKQMEGGWGYFAAPP